MQKVIIEPAQAGQRFDKFLGRHLSQAGMSFERSTGQFYL